MICAGGLLFDPETRILQSEAGGRQCDMSGQPAKFLALLMRNAGQVVTADAVMTTLYPHTQRGTDLLGVMIWKIRCAIAHVGGDRSIIHTVRGKGWLFSSPETRTALRFSAQELAALRVLVAQAPAHTRAAPGHDPGDPAMTPLHWRHRGIPRNPNVVAIVVAVVVILIVAVL